MNPKNRVVLLLALITVASGCSRSEPPISATHPTAGTQQSPGMSPSSPTDLIPAYNLVPLASRTPADASRAAMTRIPPPDLAAANAEGRLWLGDSRYAGAVPPAFSGAGGTSELECRPTDVGAVTRSGDWVVTRSASPSGGEQWTLVGADQDRLRGRPVSTLLRGRALDNSGASHVIEIDRPSQRTVDGSSVVIAPVDLPSKSDWVVVVTSEQMWGCFLATISESAKARSTTVLAAEARGSVHPRIAEPPTPPTSFGRPFLQGHPERRCAESSNSHTRSGDWVFDPLGYAANWKVDRYEMKTAWVPLHQADPQSDLTPLTVSGTLLSAPQHSYTYVSPGWVQGDQAVFFATSAFVLPIAGDWLLEAVSGGNWGCFIIRIAPVRSPTPVDPQ